ncbi:MULTISPECIES: GldM family protein [Flavobacterium]|uniref:Gliding motility-associated protein GldM C-terminal domain-containing protein n=1 Tax=Flavobacterium hankyongi TaxID=1176532 RepID=A0ABP8ZNR9_9FLAO|nr:GldM family protein [Flavobacterium sp. N1846]
MKKLLLLLVLIPLSFYAQNDSISKPNLSVIGLNNLNIAYRGIPNPISIAVSNAKPYKIKGDNIFINDEGKYFIKPKAEKESKVLLEIETSDSTKVVEEHIFRVKDLPYAAILVNQKGCINGDCVIEMPSKEILNAEISVKLIDYLLEGNIAVTGFRINLTNSKGDFLDSFEIKGNKIPQDVYEEIMANTKISLIILHKFIFESDLNLSIAKTPVVKIRKL